MNDRLTGPSPDSVLDAISRISQRGAPMHATWQQTFGLEEHELREVLELGFEKKKSRDLFYWKLTAALALVGWVAEALR